jgi:glycosyltransferase involved in cell wall biosynthesis
VSSYGLIRGSLRAVSRRRRHDEVERWLAAGEGFGRWVAARMEPSASVAYAFTSAALEIFKAAKTHGMITVLDHATAPITQELDLVDAAWTRWPDWFPRPLRSPQEPRYAERQRAEWALADSIVCGSSFLARMIEKAGGPFARCVVVPLGGRFSQVASEVPPRAAADGLRLVFAGDDGVRKGLPDFIEACRLAGIRREDATVVGALTLSPEGRSRLERHASWPGRIDRAAMERLFAGSDVLVLPTVSDTFGLVVLEAMSRGCVPIVSANAGAADIVEDGVSGFVVPVHAPAVIAERLSELAGDRARLATMRARARERATDFDVRRYGERLAAVISEAPRSRLTSG